MVINIVFILLMPSATSLQISFDSPDSVEIGKEFTVSIRADSSNTHDVKVFVHNSLDEKIARREYISEIYNDGWQDSWFYLKETFPSQKEFKIRVTDSYGSREICVRLRKSNTKSVFTECNLIEILEVVSENQDNTYDKKEEETEEGIEENNFESQSTLPPSTNPEIVPLSDNPTQTITQLNNKKIILNPKTKQELQEKTLITKSEKTRLYIIYTFTFICIIIIILLSLKKL